MSAVYADLADCPVLVTGGATGIGADIVRAFAAQGARVGFLDIQDDAAHALCADLTGARHRPVFLHCDIVDVTALEAAVSGLAAAIGPVRVLINNAADDTRHAFGSVTQDVWDRLSAVNLRAQFFAAQALAPMMQAAGGGAIVNLSSIAWRAGAGSMPVYGAAKAGVVGMTLALASALGASNIRVNAIEPGAVMTERQRRLWYPTQASIDDIVNRQALRTPLLGDHIAAAAVFLASDAGAMITKQVLVVDAGISWS